MPKDIEIQRVLLIGPGPEQIGKGIGDELVAVHACRCLKREGCEVIVLNNNPASFTTETEWIDRVYLAPLTVASLREVIVKEQPDLVLAGYGGFQAGALLAQYEDLNGLAGVRRDISLEVFQSTQSRGRFRQLLTRLGFDPVSGGVAHKLTEGLEIGENLRFPLIIRPSLSTAGSGSAIVYNQEELEELLQRGLNLSPIREVAVERALVGWEAIDLQFVRDNEGDTRLVAIGTQVDPIEIHRGNSIVINPTPETSSSYLPFINMIKPLMDALDYVGALHLRLARNPVNGEAYILDLSVRCVSHPAWSMVLTIEEMIEISVKLNLGYRLSELPEGANRDRIVPEVDRVTLPYFEFNRFGHSEQAGTTIQAVGQALAFGGNIREALQKAIRALNKGWLGFGADGLSAELEKASPREVKEKLITVNNERLLYIRQALKQGFTVAELHSLTKLAPSFLAELGELHRLEKELSTYALYNLPKEVLLKAKQSGYSDRQLAFLFRVTETEVQKTRQKFGIVPGRLRVTGRENQAESWYTTTYSSGETNIQTQAPGTLIVGTGVNRVLYGSEADWNIIAGAKALRDAGFRPVLLSPIPLSINGEPEVFDRIYIDAVTVEDILNVIALESIESVILQFGGEEAVQLNGALIQSGIKVLGTAEEDLITLSKLRPNTNLAARAVGEPQQFNNVLAELSRKTNDSILTEKLVADAVGVMVSCIGDGKRCQLAGILEQIEMAEIHPGDSALSYPPYSLDRRIIDHISEISSQLVNKLAIRGWVDFRFAIKHEQIYLLGVFPWVTSSLLLLSKATGFDWAAATMKALTGELPQGMEMPQVNHTTVKEAVFSFKQFPGMDTVLGPEKRSTGMVMGADMEFGTAFIRAQLAAGEKIPVSGGIYLSIRNQDVRAFIGIAEQLADMGFLLMATDEIAAVFIRNGIACETVCDVGEGRPNILDLMKNGEIQWIINIPSESNRKSSERFIRNTAVVQGIPMVTTLSGALAALNGLRHYIRSGMELVPLTRE